MARERHNYYLIFNHADIRLVGPFDTRDALVAHAEKWQAANGDNPCWHSVYIDPGKIKPMHYHTIPLDAP